MSLESPPGIPYELVKELADLLQRGLDSRTADDGWLVEAELALEDYKNKVALND